MAKCVVLLSGGLDSATALAIAKQQNYEVVALTVNYGQRHVAEVDAAKRVARSQGVKDHRFVSVSLPEIGGSALTDDIDVPKDREIGPEIPVTYVPARNTVFLALAMGLAEVVGADDLFVGINAVDYSGYPDCRPEFIEQFEILASLATKAGIEGRRLKIQAPLISMSKGEIIRTGIALGVDYSLTLSCYDPMLGLPCGHCDACALRRRGFEEVGIPDPAMAFE